MVPIAMTQPIDYEFIRRVSKEGTTNGILSEEETSLENRVQR